MFVYTVTTIEKKNKRDEEEDSYIDTIILYRKNIQYLFTIREKVYLCV